MDNIINFSAFKMHKNLKKKIKISNLSQEIKDISEKIEILDENNNIESQSIGYLTCTLESLLKEYKKLINEV